MEIKFISVKHGQIPLGTEEAIKFTEELINKGEFWVFVAACIEAYARGERFYTKADVAIYDAVIALGKIIATRDQVSDIGQSILSLTGAFVGGTTSNVVEEEDRTEFDVYQPSGIIDSEEFEEEVSMEDILGVRD